MNGPGPGVEAGCPERKAFPSGGAGGKAAQASDDGLHAANFQDNFSLRILAAWSSRNCLSFFRNSGSLLARMATARRAAFTAPALPTANVPTGMPPGIWAVERRES